MRHVNAGNPIRTPLSVAGSSVSWTTMGVGVNVGVGVGVGAGVDATAPVGAVGDGVPDPHPMNNTHPRITT
jgi:hypothetical protein